MAINKLFNIPRNVRIELHDENLFFPEKILVLPFFLTFLRDL